MSTYAKIRCKICGKMISTGGAGYTSHARMHVKNGEAIEFTTSKGLRFLSEAEYREHLDAFPYALLGEEPLPGQPKEIWEIPDISKHMPAVDPAAYFITSGEAVIKAEKLVKDLYSVAVKARAFRQMLQKARGKKAYLETAREDGRLLIKAKDPRKPKD